MQADRIVDVPTSFDDNNPFARQARELVDRAGLSPTQWESELLLVNLPPLASIAGLVLAEIHARHGRFPHVIRMRPWEGGFQVAEILDLNLVRQHARSAHDALRRSQVPVTAANSEVEPPQAASTNIFKPPPLIGDRYQVNEELGRGSFGVVSRAVNVQTGQAVAIKRLNDTARLSANSVERFRRERVQGQLNHPNVCQLLDIGQDAIYGEYLVFEFVDGHTLREQLRINHNFTEHRAVELTAKIAEALQVAHDHGVVHRDLKPENIILSMTGEPKITDFGMCLVLDESQTRFTGEGAVIGTLHYMAPEVLSGNIQQHSPLVDIYALGVMLYEFLTGTTPFGGTPEAIKHRILNHTVPPLTERLPKADSRLCKVVADACMKAKEDRLPSMTEFARRLREIQSTAPMGINPIEQTTWGSH